LLPGFGQQVLFRSLSERRTVPTPASILKDVFGYDEFRPLQREVIESVLAGRDTLAVMPTGGGKSLCYQIPALLLKGLTVVVSPLISLMKDQVEQLQAAGVPAVVLNSTLTSDVYRRNMAMVYNGKTRLLFVAPETLLMPRIFAMLDEVPVALLTIDEAHCISEWGHDFRPEYRQLVEVRHRYPKAACLALTATATTRVREDIQHTLEFSRSNEFLASFDRPNLTIRVERKSDPFTQTQSFLRRHADQSGIIYCFSRRQVDELAERLAQHGASVRPYHAGLDELTRKRNQEAFIRDDVQIIVATIAFGMGINKPNVRFVVHYDLPKSIEEYYQEIGRAGRDGLPAECLLLYSDGDIKKQRYFIDQKQGQERQVAEQHLQKMVEYAENNFVCRRKPLLNYFGESYTADNCGRCDVCSPRGVINTPRFKAAQPGLAASAPSLQEDCTTPAQKFLSCVRRTGDKYGATYIINVLRGVRSERITANQHESLSTYGIGKELSIAQWEALSRRLISAGYLHEEGQFPFDSLSLTEKAQQTLVQRLPIDLPVQEVAARRLDPTAVAGNETYNRALFALLRARRKELAEAQGVPPYVIFSDRTLVEMATYYPQTRTSLRRIAGVGDVKLERYGKDFLGVICDYALKHKIKEVKKRRPADRARTAGRGD
jgi:ATP-dependent DNA helicase RecQ